MWHSSALHYQENTTTEWGVGTYEQDTYEKVCCILSNDELGRKFWVEAVTYAQHLVNRLPSSTINGKTPLEVWSGKPATDYDSLHVFGSIAYYHVIESKLDPREKKALFMGFIPGVKGCRLWLGIVTNPSKMRCEKFGCKRN